MGIAGDHAWHTRRPTLTWRQRLARRLDPGHYIVAERKAAIVDRLFELQRVAIMDGRRLHPALHRAVMDLLEVRDVSSGTARPPGGRR